VVSEYAGRLLVDLGLNVQTRPGPVDAHPALAWAHSGAMALCGRPDALPRVPRGPLASCAEGVGRALAALGARPPADVAALLGEHAACAGLARRGRIAPGGRCRLLRAADGWAALHLARQDDVRDLPAWLEAEPGEGDPWEWVARAMQRRPLADLARRARWLGLPFAPAAPAAGDAPPWLRIAAHGPIADPPTRPPRVLDLSALWAGPLCGALLADAGAEVVKVESPRRPDGARAGSPRFFALLNQAKRGVSLDFASDRDRARLEVLLATADVVIESARPRALAQLGIDGNAFVAGRPGRVWVSITGYGRDDAPPGRVAFGDDAGVAAGLADAVADDEGPLFCADAIADPLTGLHAALAAWATWRQGGGALLDLSLRDVAAHALRFAPVEGFAVEACEGGARVAVGADTAPVAEPRARAPRTTASGPGADGAPRRARGPGC